MIEIISHGIRKNNSGTAVSSENPGTKFIGGQKLSSKKTVIEKIRSKPSF